MSRLAEIMMKLSELLRRQMNMECRENLREPASGQVAGQSKGLDGNYGKPEKYRQPVFVVQVSRGQLVGYSSL
jgi:hypothetical protein